jgi:predicted RNase H-like HicB family nuclease
MTNAVWTMSGIPEEVLHAYALAAVKHAKIRRCWGEGGYFSTARKIQGAWGQGETRKEARNDLREAVEGWVVVSLRHCPGATIPVIAGIDLNPPVMFSTNLLEG